MEIATSDYNTVTDFRNYLELSYQTKYDAYSFFANIESREESVLTEIGYNRFLLNNRFDFVWSSGNIDESTKIDLINYCINRLNETQNPHLAVRYNYALLVITKNNKYANGAIESYWNVLDFYLKASDSNVKNVFEFIASVKEMLQLYISYKRPEISKVANYLHDLLSNDYPLILKTGILSIFSEERIFKLVDIQHLPNICLNIYNKTLDKNYQKRTLEIGLKLSQRTKNNGEMMKFAELLGDITLQDIQAYDDNNIAISHMNELTYEKVIAYYKLAKSNEKIAATSIKLEENRTHHKYIRFPIYSKSDDRNIFIDCVNRLVAEEIKRNILEIIFPLCKNNHSSLLISYDKLRTSLSHNKTDYFYTSCFEAVRVDKWGE